MACADDAAAGRVSGALRCYLGFLQADCAPWSPPTEPCTVVYWPVDAQHLVKRRELQRERIAEVAYRLQ